MNYPQNGLVRTWFHPAGSWSHQMFHENPRPGSPVPRYTQDPGRSLVLSGPRTAIPWLLTFKWNIWSISYGPYEMEHVVLYIQETHLGSLLFWIIRTRGMICDESALKFFESPMIILYGSLRFSRFMCPRILILFHFKTLKNIWTERETEYSSKNKFLLRLRSPFMTSLWPKVTLNDLEWPRMTLMWLIEK